MPSSTVLPEAASMRHLLLRREALSAICSRLKLTPSRLSPLNPVPGSSALPAEACEEPFATAFKLLADPAVRLATRLGGGMLQASAWWVCADFAHHQDQVAMMAADEAGNVRIAWFQTLLDYVVWFVGENSSAVTEPVANYFPPPQSLESTLFVLHAIDSYRRVTYQNLLDYTPVENPFLSLAGFTSTLRQALPSRDRRWLLPSLFGALPELAGAAIDPSAEHLICLDALDFLRARTHPETQEAILVFGEAGRHMGVEFYRSWKFSVGLEATSAHGSAYRAFLAPTALANHLFVLETSATGRVSANHQALTQADLGARLTRDLYRVLEATARPGGPRCSSCQAPVSQDDTFCGACGTPVLS